MTDRRPRRLVASANLEDVAFVTFAADRDRVAAGLPAGVEVVEAARSDGRDAAIVSMVTYRYRDLHLRGLPFLRLSCGQVHLRTYVRVRGEIGVWFLGTVQDSRLASLPRWLWGMPWHRGSVVTAVQAEGSRRDLTVAADSAWGSTRLRLAPTEAHADALAGFADGRAALDLVVGSQVGWYRRGDQIGRFSVTHAPVRAVSAEVERAEVPLAADLGLEAPVAVMQPEMAIEVHLPPRRVGQSPRARIHH